MPYWCVWSSGTGATAIRLPPCVVIGLDHLGEAGPRAVMQHVGQQQRERLVADDVARAPDGVAEAERRLLAREARRARARQGSASERLELLLSCSALRERALELELDVEVVLDDALVAAGDEDEVLDAGGARLVDHVLDDRPVDDRQHLLRHGLGGGQKAGAEAGDGEHGFADAFLRCDIGAPNGTEKVKVTGTDAWRERLSVNVYKCLNVQTVTLRV